MYLKKHRSRTWATRFAAVLGTASPPSPGRVEAENALALQSLGIDVVPLMAYGEKLHADGRLESFFLSEELEGYSELQDFIQRRFPACGSPLPDPRPASEYPGCPTRSQLHRLIVQVAGIARRFHAAGFNHRDFYGCHLLVKETSQGRFDVRLIDLQRVQRRRWFRRRWIVKDLAQLASMSPDDCVGAARRSCFCGRIWGCPNCAGRTSGWCARSSQTSADPSSSEAQVMRIGLVLEQFDPARGGREQWTWSFTQRLLELGHEVHVVARSCSPTARRLPIAYHPVQCDPSPIVFAGAVRAVLVPLALDIVHDMGTGWYCDVFHPHGGSMASSAERKLLFLPAWLRGLKRMTNRMLPRHRTFQLLMERQYADHGQIVLALSRASAADFQRFHGVAPERIRIVYNGVDSERFSPEQCRPHRQPARHAPGPAGRYADGPDRGPQFPPQGRGHALAARCGDCRP